MKFMGERFFKRNGGGSVKESVRAACHCAARFTKDQAWGAKDELRARSEAMSASAATQRRGSRKRVALPVVLGFAGLAGMFTLVSQDVMAVNFTTGNNTFQIYSNYLDAHYAAGYLDPSTLSSGQQSGVSEIGINTAKLAGLCAIATESIGPLGNYSLILRAGEGVANSFTGTGIPTQTSGTLSVSPADGTILPSSTGIITANNLFMNSNFLSGYGNQISGLNLGQSADQVGAMANITWPTGTVGSQPTPGNFGLYATQLNVAGLSGNSYGLNLAGQITLPQLKIQVVQGTQTQANC